MEEVVKHIEEYPQVTLSGLKQRIHELFGVSISIGTIHSYLQGQFFTLKKVHFEPSGMNLPINKERRLQYVSNLNAYIQDGKTIIWLDETNLNLFCRRTQGRSLSGQRCNIVQPNSKGPNIHVIGAISSFQVIRWTRRRGAFKMINAHEWVVEMITNLPAGISASDVVLVVDNAPCHNNLEEIEENINGFRILRLGPYSPMLNPIENIWSKMKSYIKRKMSVPDVSPPNVGEQR